MSTTKSWIPISGNSTGDIELSGFTYTGESDDDPEIRRVTSSGIERRAYFNFQTGADPIPNRAIVEKVEFLLRISVHTAGTPPSSYIWGFYIGQDLIQDRLASNPNLVWGASWSKCCVENFAAQPTDTDVDLGLNGISYFNKSGDTDINVRCESLWGFGGADYTTTIYGVASGRSSQLKVTYRIGFIRNCKIYNAKLYSVVA